MNLEQLFWPRARVKSNERVVVSEQGRLTDIPSNPQHHPDCSLQLSLQSLVIEVEQRLKKIIFKHALIKTLRVVFLTERHLVTTNLRY